MRVTGRGTQTLVHIMYMLLSMTFEFLKIKQSFFHFKYLYLKVVL